MQRISINNKRAPSFSIGEHSISIGACSISIGAHLKSILL